MQGTIGYGSFIIITPDNNKFIESIAFAYYDNFSFFYFGNSLVCLPVWFACRRSVSRKKHCIQDIK